MTGEDLVEQRRAFVRAIRDEPDDDAHRLVFADWLEEHGDEHDRQRARFVRLLAEAAGLPLGDPRRRELRAEADAIAEAHQPAWMAGIEGPFHLRSHPLPRGFVEVVQARAEALDHAGDALFEREPVTHLKLTQFSRRGPPVERVAGWGWLSEVRHLDLRESLMQEAGLATLLASPHLGGLRELQVSLFRMGPSPVRALAANPRLRGLSRLTLDSLWAHGDDIAAALAAAKNLPNLTHLTFGSNGVGPRGAAALAASPVLRSVTHLTFDGDRSDGPRLGDEGLAALMRSPHLKRLKELRVEYQDVGDAGVIALAESPNVTGLVRLALEVTTLGAAGAEALGRSRRLAGLEELILKGVPLGNEGAKAFARGTALRRLRWLEMPGRFGSPHPDNRIGDRGLAALASSAMLAGLRVLNLEDNRAIGDEGLIALARSPYLTELEELDLRGGRAGPEGAKALASSPNAWNLRVLKLAGHPIGDAGAKALARSAHLSNLRELNLGKCDIRAAGGRAVAASPNLANVKTLYFYDNPMREATKKEIERK